MSAKCMTASSLHSLEFKSFSPQQEKMVLPENYSFLLLHHFPTFWFQGCNSRNPLCGGVPASPQYLVGGNTKNNVLRIKSMLSAGCTRWGFL